MVTLDKSPEDGTWMVNKKFPVRKDAIKLLLLTFKNLHVRSPVSNSARNTVIKDIAAVGTKVEIYIKGELIKTYYVGRETPDNLGTYMILENAPNAYVMGIQGFNGYLTPRYITKEVEWRDQVIFNFAPGNISALRLENGFFPESSFEIKVLSINKFLLLDHSGQELADADPGAVFSFLSRFQQINYESFAKVSDRVRDSVIQSKPMYIFTLLDGKGKSTELKVYRKYSIPGEQAQLDGQGKPSPYDTARMYAKKSGEEALLLVQNFVFDKILPSVSDLRKKIKNN
jgi:hypothetical protein